MALIASLESDLRMLAAEARRKFPAIKDSADRSIFKVRLASNASQLAGTDDVMKTFLLACESRNNKLSIMGLAGVDKLIAHDAVAPSVLPSILAALKERSDMTEEIVQLKTLQLSLTILQSQLYPRDEDQMAIILGLCLRLLGNSRNSDSVHSTAVATVRQAVALIFDSVLRAENLPVLHYGGTSGWSSSSNSVAGEVSRSISTSELAEDVYVDNQPLVATGNKALSEEGRLALHLFEDLTSFAGGGSATWLQVPQLQRSFALDMLEYVLSHYAVIFKRLSPFAQIDSVVGEPAFRRLLLRSVASVTRLYNSMLTTECEVFMSMLIKSIDLDLPPWHHIMVLETLRGLCVEARMLCHLFKTFDMKLKNTDMVSSIVHTLARVVTRIELLEGSEETLIAVAGMFHCKSKGIEWTPEGDPSGMGALIASEAQAVTLAAEGLLGVIFTVATLTDEAVGLEELIDSSSIHIPDREASTKIDSKDMVSVCTALVNSVWRPLLEALSFILTRTQGEAIVSEIFKGYQAFTKACGVLYAVEPRDSFLASLCRFTFAFQNDPNRSWAGTASSGGKRPDLIDIREPVILSYKNIQAMRTLFNISHQLNLVLGPTSWILVLETLEVLDMVMHSAHSLSQDGIGNAARIREPSSELSILTMYDAQMFESTGKMSIPALSFFLTALRQVSNTFVSGLASSSNSTFSTVSGSATNNVTGQAALKMWAVERMLSTLMFNVHRLELVWDQVTDHLLELVEHDSQQVRTGALDALDRAICGILASPQFQESVQRALAGEESNEGDGGVQHVEGGDMKSGNGHSSVSISKQQSNENIALECTLLQPLSSLYNYGRITDVRAGALRILLHVLERHAEKLDQSWRSILELLRLVANASEKDLVPLGFQNLRVILNDGLLSIPAYALELCIEVAGAYVVQKKDVNISLTAIGALWTTADFFARGVNHDFCKAQGLRRMSGHFTAMNMSGSPDIGRSDMESEVDAEVSQSTPDKRLDVDNDALLLAVYGVIQGFITDDRPEIRHSAIRTLFQSMSSHGNQLSTAMWEHCIGTLVFPMVDTVQTLASTSSQDEWHGKELGTEGGKPVHMLVHHSRNTAQKQWDETLVLVLGGTSRLLKSYFKVFQSLNDFKNRWAILLAFIGESIVYGSKEVSLAAIASLNPLLISQAAKDNLPPQYFEAAFSMYESVVPSVVQPDSRVVPKAQKELLQSLGDLYNNGHLLFSTSCYLRLLVLVDLFVWIPISPGDLAVISQVQQTVLAVLPLVKPANDYLSPLWLTFIYQVLSYLPEGNHSKAVLAQAEHLKIEDSNRSLFKFLTSKANGRSSMVSNPSDLTKAKEGYGNGSLTQQLAVAAPERSSQTLSVAFSEKLIKVVLELHEACPPTAAATGIPDIVAAFGRCMATRRDSPKEKLWKTAVNAFICVLRKALIWDAADNEHHVAQENLVASGTIRSRFWKEVADVYDKFMVGACGRAISLPAGSTLEPEVLEADEQVENMVLCFLTDELLTCCQDAPREVLHHLVGVVDQCAARTSALPLASVVLLPAHCGRFSLSCLEKLFVLCSCESHLTGESSNVIVSQIAIPILLARCKAILHRFAEIEKELGNSTHPQIIMDEVSFVLKGLARLVLHPLTATHLSLPVRRSEVRPEQNQHEQEFRSRSSSTIHNVKLQPHLNSERAHLFLLYRNFCELLTTRVLEVRELLQALLVLVGTELGL
ncbi:hypothetical protein KC19_10G013800 [Ceratodon purpureus]|uniref:Protein MON2 homolog n=1 Tax=Ceratodon purpureus TaxID=3225 RepID=A0A8T0GG12_CERPU|nr:hypothetical protein KC19_10G013800 [Ceratodon purpureus]